MTDKSKSYFRSSGYTTDSLIKTDSGETLELSTLPAFLRTLMVMDGTVTKALSAWFWESVKVQPLHNQIEILTIPMKGMKVQSGDAVLKREVTLRGANSNQLFACARSVVSLKHLPSEIAVSLEKGEMGIGELLRENGVETYRDIFNINYLPNKSDEDSLLLELSGEIVSRSYRIRVNGKPAIIVTEFFPIELYKRS